jgi:hypothetical protein
VYFNCHSGINVVGVGIDYIATNINKMEKGGKKNEKSDEI